jgi:hypothetical protein
LYEKFLQEVQVVQHLYEKKKNKKEKFLQKIHEVQHLYEEPHAAHKFAV